MQFPLPFTNILTIPYGATSGPRIVIDGTRGAIFIYGTGAHSLVTSITGPNSGTDQYGNGYGGGITSQNPTFGTFISMNQGVLDIGSGLNRIIEGDYRGLRYYNTSGIGTVPGNLIASQMSQAMSDSAGNSVLQGTSTYFLTGGVWYAFNLNNGQLSLLTATTEGGPWTSVGSLSLYGAANVGGATLSAPTVLIQSNNNSGLTLTNGVNSWQAEELLSYVAAGEAINTQTGLTQDVYLSFSTLQPSAVYEVEAQLYFTAASGVDFKWSWAIGGTGDVFRTISSYNQTGGTFAQQGDIYTASQQNVNAAQTVGTGNANVCVVKVSGVYTTAAASGSPGVFGLMWAQNTSSSNALTLFKGSSLTLRRIG